MKNRLTELLHIEHPIIQAGMSWASSSPALPAAVSNAGGLGVLAAGPMYPDKFAEALDQLKAMTDRTYAVNIPLYRPHIEEILEVMVDRRVPVVVASQGGPRLHLQRFRAMGSKWIHVVSTLEHAIKAEAAGVDALVVVGAEAGGHPPVNGVSTLVTVREVLRHVSIPVIAGGGVADGWGIAALLALGAEGVQLGTRFLMTDEATVHVNYKAAVQKAQAADAVLVGVRSLPIRMLRNRFAQSMLDAESIQVDQSAYEDAFKASSLRQAALDGDIDWGKVEAGQSAGLVDAVQPAAVVMQELIAELDLATRRLAGMASEAIPA
jgi:enoyl-[acyl-carrier protein] reductase II